MAEEELITDVTLDHLPDLSEASVSFQIPANTSPADFLLADHTDGFNLLRDADDGVSFTPFRDPRGQPLTLAELTPRVDTTPRPAPPDPRSPTPTTVPSSSAKPAVTQPPLTLGHASPRKRRKTPSRLKSSYRHLRSPLVSEERLDHLRIEVETLGQPDATPSHVVESAESISVECQGPSCSSSPRKNNPSSCPPPFALDPVPEKKSNEASSDQDLVLATSDSGPAHMTNIVAIPAPHPKSKRNPRTTATPATSVQPVATTKRHAVSAAHVSKKSKRNPSRVREAPPVHPSVDSQRTPPQSIAIYTKGELVPPACMSGDPDLKSRNTQHDTGGLAERLVSYGQKLISSIGLSKPSLERSSAEDSKEAVRAESARPQTQLPSAVLPPLPPRTFNDPVSSAHIAPFRLSEISPQKPPPPNAAQPSSPGHTGVPQDGKPHVLSPMRPAKKRISTDADVDLLQEYYRCKQSKTVTTDAERERRSPDEAVSQPHARPTKRVRQADEPFRHRETRQSTLDSRTTLPSARTKYRPQLNSTYQRKGPTLDRFPYVRQVQDRGKRERDAGKLKATSASLAGFSASSRARQRDKARFESVIAPSHARQHSGPASTADLPLIEKKQCEQNATLSVAQLTKPVGFTFRVDARVEARKTEGRLAESEPGWTPGHAVLDAKAQPAWHSAMPKAGASSVSAVPFVFCTEQRAKEREKFDAMVRRKEEAMERQKEAQRRQEAEEEERAIKALRRKAIPKANEIPEWYADMPRRKGTAV